MSFRRATDDQFLQQVIGVIEVHLEEEQFGVSELAREMGMSRSNLHRRIHSVTGKSASNLIAEIRLEKALELLKNTGDTVSEVAYKVGFSSATYFTKCFHDHFGYPPSEVAISESTTNDRSGSLETQLLHIPRKKKRLIPWMITTIAVLAAAWIVSTFILFNGREPNTDIVIAVLPFYNDSPEEEHGWVINGLLNEILNKLSLMDEVEVLPRRTMDSYRGSAKSIQEIGRELNASYVLDGSATVLENNTSIRIELIETSTGDSRWSAIYERAIALDNPFEVQKEVALAIIDELSVALSPEERENINFTPSENREAYDVFLKADEILTYDDFARDYDRSRVMRAKELLETALELDSSFAAAYTMLGHVYINKMYYYWPWDPARSYACLDTGIRFVDRALSFYEKNGARARPRDENYYSALNLKAGYFALQGIHDEAERIHLLAKKGRNGNYIDYRTNIYWYYVGCHNFGAAIENYLHYLEEKPHDEIVSVTLDYYMFNSFCACGFPGLANEYSEKILQWEGDTLAHYVRMRNLITRQGNFPEAIRRTKELMEVDPDPSRYLADLAYEYACMGDKDRAMQVTRQRLEQMAREGLEPGAGFMYGYYYMQLGDQDKARPPLLANLALETGHLEYPTEEVQLGIPQLDIALTYSILGNREKTLEYMTRLSDVQHIDIRLITRMKNWPTFDLVRDTPEFKNILKGLESKYEEEHEKIANHLREHGINPV